MRVPPSDSARRVATAAAVALLAVACSADVPSRSSDPSPVALEWNEDVDLADLRIAVGSKSTAEQRILGHLAVEALSAAGAQVIDQTALGSTLDVRDAQLGGLIDLYWEYTGTGWVELLREIGPSTDPDELADAVAATDLDENQISWLPPAPANSTFAIARGPDLADDLAIENLSDFGELIDEETDGAVLCVPAGGRFLTDPGGLVAVNEALTSRVRGGQLVPVASADLVEAVEVGVFCPFGQVERTAASLIGADVELLDDDVGAFLIRNPAVTIRAEVLAEFPEIETLFAPVAAALTDEVLRELNAAVALDGRGPRTVAREWLVDEGLADF